MNKDINNKKNLKVSFMLISILIVCSLGISAVSASSTNNSTIYVSNQGNDSWDGQLSLYNGTSGPKLTIKNATGTVSENGTVHIANGNYNESNIEIATNMIITGESQQGTVINAQGNNYIFTVDPGVNLALINLTLKNGNSTGYGGAIYNEGNLTITNSTFNNNTAQYGGAIYTDGNLTVTGSTFTNNNAQYGGAIYNDYNLTVTNSTFNNNTAYGGGAIYTYDTLTITGSTFTNNNAQYGGAIYTDGNLTVTGSTFTNNTAEYDGGAIYTDGNLTVTGSTFTNNNAEDGGAIYTYDNLTVTGSTFTNNNAQYEGGAIYSDSTLTVTNSAFTNNTAKDEGGAIYSDSTLTVTNSAFMNNNAEDGGAIYSDGYNLTITGSAFMNNIAQYGGAIYADYVDNNLTITNSTFTNNNAQYGGAIYTYYSILNITSSKIQSNTAGYAGGAIYNIGYDSSLANPVVNFNLITGNTAMVGSAIYSLGNPLDAKYNWWGSNSDPSSNVRGNVNVSPWLVLTVTAKPTSIPNNSKTVITADLLHDSNGNSVNGHVPDGIPVTFATTLGTVVSSSSTSAGSALSTLTSGLQAGTAFVSATVNGQTIQTPVTVTDSIAPKISSIYPKRYATGVYRSNAITIKLSENIKSSVNWSKVYIKNLKTGKKVSISKLIKNNRLYLKTSKRSAYTWYQVYIPASAIKDYAGNNLVKGYTWKFKTGRY